MTTTRKAREYLRVSYDRSGRERSQDEQHGDNDRAADGAGLTLGKPYRENGSASASRYATKTRDVFAELLADLERDRFGADVLMIWESSRGSRRVGEWVTLIELCEQRKVGIFVTTHSREYDPGNARDRRSLLEDAVDSEYESAKVSARSKRSAAANAAAGKPHGAVPYGYVRRYDARTGALVAQEPEPTEAVIVRELYDRLRKGHSLRAIAQDFEARGVRSRAGKVFKPQTLRGMALRPLYCGLRVHDPERAHRQGQRLDGATEATWEGLVSRETYFAVRQLLTRPERRTSRPGKGKHLLSLIPGVVCDACDGILAVTTRRPDQPEYACQSGGHVRISKADLDKLAEAVMLGYLARDDVHEAMAARDADDPELQQIRDDLAKSRGELEEARNATPASVHEARMLGRLAEGLAVRVAELEAAERELSMPAALAGMITPGRDVARRWKAAPMSARREVARMLLTPELLGELRVQRRPPGWPQSQHCPVEERVTWRRKR